MLEYMLIIVEGTKKALITLYGDNVKLKEIKADDEILESNKIKLIPFNKDAYESIFSVVQKNKLKSIEFIGEDVFSTKNREEIIEFCKALHDDERVIETQLWANTHYKYGELKAMNSNSVEDLFDQLDFMVESDGTTIDLGATAVQELFGNTDPVIIK